MLTREEPRCSQCESGWIDPTPAPRWTDSPLDGYMGSGEEWLEERGWMDMDGHGWTWMDGHGWMDMDGWTWMDGWMDGHGWSWMDIDGWMEGDWTPPLPQDGQTVGWMGRGMTLRGRMDEWSG